MKLSSLRVINYRGLRDISIPLSSFVCITGENNGGKSSVLQTLSLLLSGSSLKATDYFDGSQPITISLAISNITEGDLNLLAPEHRDRIAQLVKNGSLTLVRKYATDGKSQLGYEAKVPKDGRFSSESLDQLISGKKGTQIRDAVISAFPEIAAEASGATTQKVARELIQKLADGMPDAEKALEFVSLPTGLDKSIIPMLPERIYIPAVKDLADDTKTAETSSFGKILGIVMRVIEPLLVDEKDFFKSISRKLTRVVGADGKVEDNRLPALVEIEKAIEGYVRQSFTTVSLEIEIPPPEIKTLLSTARILADDGVKGPLEGKGDGLRRAIVFAILRAYVEVARKSNPEAGENKAERGYLLLFEEPELFLHPDAQKMLFDSLGIFAKKNHVVVTTHSPLFLGPEATATFVRLSKTTEAGAIKPFTKACFVDLSGMSAKDEFQLICFENNTAAFFAKKVVLVEGDSDFIAFPHIAETLNSEWNFRSRSISLVRVGGKTSIERYRNFFSRFDVPVFSITDMDSLEDGFDKLAPSQKATELRTILLQKADALIGKETKAPNSEDIKNAQPRTSLRSLWDQVRSARAICESDKTKFSELDNAVTAFFNWEREDARRKCIREATDLELKKAKLELIWELRRQGAFIMEQGSLDNYYPKGMLVGPDKPSKAQDFCKKVTTRQEMLRLSPEQECPAKSPKKRSEFEFVFSSLFRGGCCEDFKNCEYARSIQGTNS